MRNPVDRIPILFDCTRLLNRGWRTTPTGIDRVDLAYVQALRAHPQFELQLIAFGSAGPRRLRAGQADSLIGKIVDSWQQAEQQTTSPSLAAVLDWLSGVSSIAPKRVQAPAPRGLWHALETLRPHLTKWWLYWNGRSIGGKRQPGNAIYLNTSHGQFFRPRVSSWLELSGIHAVFFIHDLIPIQYPQYNRVEECGRHIQRMAVVSRFSSHVLVNSVATQTALHDYLRAEALREPPASVLALGIDKPVSRATQLPAALTPYFVILGTIEPRKNHALLLRCWTAMAETLRDRTPKLVIVGRRGWNNEDVFGLLEHSALIGRHVIECNDLNDCDVHALLAGAQAMLVPSFAEGYSLPVVEALAAGVPVIASDIPVHREVGGEFAEYLAPDDDAAWIARLSHQQVAVRSALAGFQSPSWDSHIDKAVPILQAVIQKTSAKT